MKVPFLRLVFFVGCHAAQPSTQPLAPTLSLPPPHPIVADVTQDQVRIQFPTVLNLSYQPVSSAEQITTLQAEADRACGLYGRIASQPISACCISVQLFMDLALSQFDEIEHRMKTWGTVTGNEHGYCKTQEHLYACTPVDGED